MGIRRRIAYAYPGTHRIGIAGVVLDDRRVLKIAIGSVERDVAAAYLTSFKPDEMVAAVDKLHDMKNADIFIPDTVSKFRYAHPGWSNRRVPFVDRASPHKGPYIHNVWKLFYDDCIRRSDVMITHLNVEEFNPDWIEANRPQGVKK